MSDALPLDPLEHAITIAATRALRARAAVLRKRAAGGVTVVNCGDRPPVVVVASESAHALKIARDFDRIAAALEAERAEHAFGLEGGR
jgi:hypothetical protein